MQPSNHLDATRGPHEWTRETGYVAVEASEPEAAPEAEPAAEPAQ